MATEVKLPDEIEGVEDVTINRWLVKAGQEVKKGEPILEVATEKVDTQIESPADGTILQLNFTEGELVAAGTVLALIGAPGETPVQAPAKASEQPKHVETVEAEIRAVDGDQSRADEPSDARATPVARRVAQEEGVPLGDVKGSGTGGQVTKEDVLAFVARQKETPEESAAGQPAEPAEQRPPAEPAETTDEELSDVVSLAVGRLAAENNIDLRTVAAGRPLRSVTRYDVMSAIATRDAGKPVTIEPLPRPVWSTALPAPDKAPDEATHESAAAPTPAGAGPQGTPAAPQAVDRQPATMAQPGAGEELVPHTRMRTLVARNTVQAAFSIPHVTTWWDVEMTAVVEHRKAHKAEYAAASVNLTFTAYFVLAAMAGLTTVPAANASWSDEGIILKRYYNLGIAVALPADKNGLGGLIVPVIKNAGDSNLMGAARAVNDLAQRARDGKLRSDELQGGTFTITNYGTSGSRFQTPIMAGNQSGILGVGAMEKRPVVVSRGSPLEANTGDYLAFLPMVTLGFSYDHRILDGATADAFCAAVKNALENWK